MKLETAGNIDLAAFVSGAICVSRESIREEIERRQEELLDRMCGPRYRPKGSCRRLGYYWKSIITSVGVVRFRAAKVRADGRVIVPVLHMMGMSRMKYSMDVVARCVDLASRLSYQDAGEQFLMVTGIRVPKRPIHALVQRVAPLLLREVAPSSSDIIFADSTEVRSIKRREMNRVDVAVAWNDGKKNLVHIGVNEGWRKLEGSERAVVDALEKSPDEIIKPRSSPGLDKAESPSDPPLSGTATEPPPPEDNNELTEALLAEEKLENEKIKKIENEKLENQEKTIMEGSNPSPCPLQ